jgi:hypothetical protein
MSLVHSQAVWILIVYEGTVGPFRGFSLGYLRARHPSSLHCNMFVIIFFEAIVDFLAWISVLIRYLARTDYSFFRVEWSFSVVCTFQANSMRPTIQKLKFHNFISVLRQTKSGIAYLFVKVFKLHPGTHTHTHPVRPLRRRPLPTQRTQTSGDVVAALSTKDDPLRMVKQWWPKHVGF